MTARRCRPVTARHGHYGRSARNTTARYTVPPGEWCEGRQDDEKLSKGSSTMLLEGGSGHIGVGG